MRDVVTADVRSAVRGIRAAKSQIGIQQRSIKLANDRIDLAYEMLKTGGGSTRDIVEAQTLLLTAQDSYETAVVNLRIQVLQFLRDSGILRVDPDAGAIGQALDRRRPTRPPTADAGAAGAGAAVENEIRLGQ